MTLFIIYPYFIIIIDAKLIKPFCTLVGGAWRLVGWLALVSVVFYLASRNELEILPRETKIPDGYYLFKNSLMMVCFTLFFFFPSTVILVSHVAHWHTSTRNLYAIFKQLRKKKKHFDQEIGHAQWEGNHDDDVDIDDDDLDFEYCHNHARLRILQILKRNYIQYYINWVKFIETKKFVLLLN